MAAFLQPRALSNERYDAARFSFRLALHSLQEGLGSAIEERAQQQHKGNQYVRAIETTQCREDATRMVGMTQQLTNCMHWHDVQKRLQKKARASMSFRSGLKQIEDDDASTPWTRKFGTSTIIPSDRRSSVLRMSFAF